MSYNNRRGTPNHTNIGTRRQTAAANFVPGGQLTPQKGGVQQNQQQQRGYGSQQQNKPQQQQQPTIQQKQSTPQQNVAPQQQQQQLQQPSPQQPQWKPEEPVKSEGMENGSEQKDEKKKWLNRTKAPKKERLRRRNQRLGKLLQPKCAVMILNELTKNATFSVIDYVSTEGVQYKAVVNVDGVDHSGFGRSKISAKNAAAETAIKFIFQNRKISPMNTSEISQDGTEKMDTGDEVVEDSNSLPWQQVASFALFKLFNSWGANPHVLKDDSAVRKTNPSKKMPENAASLNPIMLLNQMYPHAKFEDLPQTGTTPNFVFNTKCSVEQQSFTGSGPTKKLAKKNVAFHVCHSLLGVQYAPEVFTPTK